MVTLFVELPQVPRLTSVLRALAGSDFDVDSHYLARQKALQAQPKAQPQLTARAAARSPLAALILGTWDKGGTSIEHTNPM